VRSTLIELLARLGYAARGAVFLIIGYFCAVASVVSTRPLDSHDAFRALLTRPLGNILVGAIAVGLFCFAGWRLAQALLDTEGCGSKLRGYGKRFAFGASAIFYMFFASLTLSVFVGMGSGNSDAAARDWAGRLLTVPFGRWLIATIGLVLIGTGVGTAVAGLSAEYANRMSLSSEQRRLVVALGVVGYLTRAIVFAMIGLFFFFAALHANASEATGVAGTLRTIQGQRYGAVLLGITAAGLLSFGAFGIAEALFRRIPTNKLETRRPAWLSI